MEEFGNVKQVLDTYAEQAQRILKDRLEAGGRRATGDLIDTLTVKVYTNYGTVYDVILNARSYLKYLEYGTKPHWPPQEPIVQWVRNKNLPTREATGNKELPTEQQLAFLVRRKISKFGTERNDYIANTVQELNAQYMPLLTKAMEKDVTDQLKIIHNQLRMQ